MSGNIADFVLDSNAPVTFKIAVGGKVILDEIYTPTSAGAITIKLRKVIEQQLTLSIPTSDFFEQSKSVIYFLATIDTIDYGFRVVKGGVDANVLDAATYFSQNFLTWQPQSKQVKLNDPEWLTYFSAVYATKVVKAKGYYLDNTTETIVAYTIDEEPKCWTMNMQYALLAGKFTAAPSYIDVWVEDSNGVRLTFIQRYILHADFDEFDDLFVFENSLGGIDTIRYTGTLQEINEPDVASAIFGEETMEYGLDVDRYFSKNTGGFKSERHQQWAVDFFNSYNRYRIADGVVRRIVLRKADIKGVKRDVNSFSFNFAYTKQTNRLNLARFDTLPDVIEMVDPNSELFFLAPRLSEFPTAPLAYNFLFPIQSPYEKKWYKASIYEIADLLTTEGGVGQNALNSEKWDGHRWDDYMEQALKKASDVEFHNAKVNNLQAADTVINSLVSALYQSGFNGNGFKIDADGNAEVKSLMVRDQLTVLELVVQKLRSIGGMIILSSANGKATKVELKENTYYRITLDTTGTLTHSFVIDDLVKCQRFNGGVKSYWRRVVAVGADYIDITKDSGEGTGIPENGDEIVQLGNVTDTSRQNAIILDATALPRIDIYQGINTYSLDGKLKSRLGDLSEQGIQEMGIFTSQGKFTGQVVIGGGSTGYENFTDKPDLSIYPLKTYVDGAFKDGVISQAEASAIEKYKAQVNAAFNDTIATYNVIYANTYLEGTSKTDLLNAKVTMAGAKDNLIASITNAIFDGKTTVSEKADVDAKYALWDSALSTYKSKLEAANKAIQQKLDAISKGYVDGLQIGGRNIITNASIMLWNSKNASYTNIATKNADGSYTVQHNNLYNAYGAAGNVFPTLAFEAGQYVLRVDFKKSAPGTYSGLQFRFLYTDATSSGWIIAPADGSRVVLTLISAINKTVLGVSVVYGSDQNTIIYNIKLEKGNKETAFGPAPEDVDAAILDAKTAGTAAQNSANAANESIGSLNSYVDGAFKDGVIDSSEAKAIDKLNKQINIDYDLAVNNYNVVYANAYLEGTAKTDLLNAKINLVSAKDALQASINTAIADGKTTPTEKADVDSKFATYATNFKDYQTKLSNANKAIQQKLDAISKGYVDAVQIGGRNLYKKTTAIVTLVGTPVVVRDNGTDPDCVNGFKIAGASGVTCGVRLQDVITKNGSYVISFWGKSNGTPALSMDIADNNVSGGLVFSTTWKKFVVKVTVANYDATFDFLDINNIPWVTIWVKDFKIEEGTKETDWSPAPEDVNAEITAVKSTVSDMAADGKLTPSEKLEIKRLWLAIQNSYSNTCITADQVGWAHDDLDDAFILLAAYINPLLASMTTTSTIFRDTFNANINNYLREEVEVNNAVTLAVNSKVDAAAYLSEAIKGSTDITGGLVATNLLLLKDLLGAITGGMSGLANDNTGFWTGGTYEQALSAVAKTIFRKDGSGHVAGGKILFDALGALMVGAFEIKNGNIVGYADNQEKIRLHTGAIDTLASIISAGWVDTGLNFEIKDYSIGIIYDHLDGGEDTMLSLDYSITRQIVIAESTVLKFISSGVSFSYYPTGAGLSHYTEKFEITGININILPTPTGVSQAIAPGTYTIVYKIHVESTSSDNVFHFVSATNNNTHVEIEKGIERTEIGKNGLLSYFGSNNYFNFSQQSGFQLRGATNMPGILATGSVTSGAAHNNKWGAKISGNSITKGGTGIFVVPHTVGSITFTAIATCTATGYYAAVTAKANGSITVTVKSDAGVASDQPFDYVIMGAN